MDDTATKRLFFALWPDDRVRASISSALDQLPAYRDAAISGRRIKSQNLHMTLHFLGNINDESQSCMHQAAQSVTAPAFQLRLETYGYFRRAKAFWLGPRFDEDGIPQALTNLHRRLGAALEGCGYQVEDRPYSPHVSLLRKCYMDDHDPELESVFESDGQILWPVDHFALIQSVPSGIGVSYYAVEKYPLS